VLTRLWEYKSDLNDNKSQLKKLVSGHEPLCLGYVVGIRHGRCYDGMIDFLT